MPPSRQRHIILTAVYICVIGIVAVLNDKLQLLPTFLFVQTSSPPIDKFHRSVRQNDGSSSHVEVPRMVHFILGDNPPAYQVRVMEYSIKKAKHYGFNVVVHQDKGIENLIYEKYPSFVQAWESLKKSKGAGKGARIAGFARILLLYHYGGIYLESDVVMCHDLTKLVDEPGVATFPQISWHRGRINNAVMSGPPGHLVFEIALTTMIGNENLASGNFMITTGPVLIARSVETYFEVTSTHSIAKVTERDLQWLRSGLVRFGVNSSKEKKYSTSGPGTGSMRTFGLAHLHWNTWTENRSSSMCETNLELIEDFLDLTCSNIEEEDAILWPECGKESALVAANTKHTGNVIKTSNSNNDDIHVPSDMWRYPTESNEYVELMNCCANTVPEPRDSYRTKFSMPCSSETNTLRYHGPGMGLTPNDLRAALRLMKGDFVILGNSVFRQWFETLACYIGSWDSWTGFATVPIESHRDAFEAKITESLMAFSPSWKEKGNLGITHGSKDYSQFGSYDIPTDNQGGSSQKIITNVINRISIPEVVDMITYFNERYPLEFHREKPIFVINLGLHYNIHSAQYLKDDLYHLAKACHDLGAQCIFPETSPQHFDSPAGDGLYPLGKDEKHCMPNPPSSFATLGAFRNDILHDVINNVGSSDHGFLKVMPLFDRLAGLNSAHQGGDCTHFYSNPEYWEPWHISLTEVLMDSVGQSM